MTKFKVTTEHCFFDYFPVAFRFEDLCLCESHAREVFEKLSAAQQSVQPTIATAALEDSPFETGIRRNAVVLPNRNSG